MYDQRDVNISIFSSHPFPTFNDHQQSSLIISDVRIFKNGKDEGIAHQQSYYLTLIELYK